MSKPVTKYEQILAKARLQLTDAESVLAKRRAEAVAAIGSVEKEEAVVNALRSAYHALEKELKPTPRKRPEKPSTSQATAKEPTADRDPICGVCGNKKAFDDHQPGAKDYHEFDSGKPAARKIPAGLCSYTYPEGHACLAPAGNAIHDVTFGYAGYHEFVAAKPTRKKREKKGPPAVIPIEGQGIDGNGLAADMES